MEMKSIWTSYSSRSFMRVGIISVFIIVSAFSVRIPGPLDPIPSFSVGGVFLGVTEIYTFFLGILVVLSIVHSSVRSKETHLVVPRSVRHVTFLSVFVIISALVNRSFGIGVIPESFQWIGLALLVIVVPFFIRSEDEVNLFLEMTIFVSVLKAAIVLFSLVNFDQTMGEYGMFETYAVLGSYGSYVMGMGLLITVAFLISEGFSLTRVVLLPILAIPIVLSNRRQVIVGVAFAIVLLLVWRILLIRLNNTTVGGIWPVANIVILLGLCGVVLFPGVRQAVFQAMEPLDSVSEPRYHIYQTGLNMFADNPMFGVGAENWYAAKPTYATEGLISVQGPKDWGVHSYHLKILSELGLVAYTVFLFLIVIPVRQATLKGSDSFHNLWSAIFALSVFFIFISTVASISKIVQTLWFLLIGVSSALIHVQDDCRE